MRMIVFFIVCIFLGTSTLAFSGVNPRSYEIDFKPNYTGNFSFSFAIDGNSKLNLRTEGNLSKYIKLNKQRISGHEKVVASLSLPQKIDTAGTNQIKIMAGNVVGIIKINVPYPNKYLKLELDTPNINIGENLNINLNIFNMGNDSVLAKPKIEIYKNNKKIDTVIIKDKKIQARKSNKTNIILNTSNYSADDYFAVAMAECNGRSFQTKNQFKIGKHSIKILNYTKEVKKNKINKVEVKLESLWNNDMNNVYIEVEAIGFKNVRFTTPKIKLKKWETATMTGFLDTAKIPGKELKLKITTHYDGETTFEIVKLKVVNGLDYVFYGIVIGCLLSLILLVWKGRSLLKSIKNRNKK